MDRHILESVKHRYEKFPYPDFAPYWGPLRYLLKPKKSDILRLRYEHGQYLRTGKLVPHSKRTQILVAGSGAFEPIAVAIANPQAQITAVDFSETALRQLRIHALCCGISPWRLRTIQADLNDDLKHTVSEPVDYILCTGVLHHSLRPFQILKNLNALLKKTGLLRLMVYAPESRLWIYELQKYFKTHIDTKNLKPEKIFSECYKLIGNLSPQDPLRTSFETYSDARSISGLIDGFFHPCEKPIAIHELENFTKSLKLKLLGFGHLHENHPYYFFRELELCGAKLELIKQFQNLTAWQKIELLDDLTELSVNPVFWLSQTLESVRVQMPPKTFSLEDLVDGEIIGSNGCLPLALFQNRDESLTPSRKLGNWKPFEGISPKTRWLRNLGKILSSFENPKQREEFIFTSLKALSQRVTLKGVELPGLTLGDFLKELLSLGKTPAQIEEMALTTFKNFLCDN